MNELEKQQFQTLKAIIIENSHILKIGVWDIFQLDLNLTNKQLNSIDVLMQSFEKRLPDFSYRELKNKLEDEIGLGYDTTKLVITMLYKGGFYKEVIQHFVKNMAEESKGVISGEYNFILNEINQSN